MILTVFRSRLNAQTLDDYRRCTERTVALVRALPGYTGHKSFVADDGERVTLVEFASEDALHAWARHPVHAEAKRNGRAALFTEYRVQVCHVLRDSAERPGH